MRRLSAASAEKTVGIQMKEQDMRTMFFKLPSFSSKAWIRALASLTCYAAMAVTLWMPSQSSAQTLADFIQLGRNKVGSYQYDGANTPSSPQGEAYTIVGGGNDTWDRWDELAFAYHELA